MATNEEIAAQVRAGGNLPGGYVYDAAKDEVRKMTAEEARVSEDAIKAEANAAAKRAKVLASVDLVGTPDAGQ